ncbi:MAG: HD domain-containing protein [Pyrinomonadaceae bacterium]
MSKSVTLEDAIFIALQVHEGQKDKAGSSYILHPLRLMLRMKTEEEMMAAVLHDIIEDSSWTIEQLRDKGFPENVLAAVECLTRRDDETYEQFIERVRTNPVARRAKIADLEDNMNVRRFGKLTAKDLQRLEKYHQAWQILTSDIDSQNGTI